MFDEMSSYHSGLIRGNWVLWNIPPVVIVPNCGCGSFSYDAKSYCVKESESFFKEMSKGIILKSR